MLVIKEDCRHLTELWQNMIQFDLKITKRRALMVILIAISVMVIDSTIVKYIAFSNKEYPIPVYVSIFVALAVLFVGIIIVLLGFVKRKDTESGLKRGLSRRTTYLIIASTQLLLVSLMIIIIQPTLALKSYNTLTLLALVFISHITSLFFLIMLVLTLVDSIMAKGDKILSLYTISFSLTAIAIMTSLIYATYVLSNQPSNIRPLSIHNSFIGLPRAEAAIYFGPALDITSLLSFVSVWIASAVLMYTYSRRIGKIRYWMIISIPLIYFLFPFEKNVVDIFQSLIISSPVLYGVLNVTIFSATKQIGAFFFSLVFLAASTLVTKHEMQKYLLISAIGMAVLYGSIEIETLLFATYPPFGVVTASFIPMGAYLVFTGIIRSATLVAQDSELRREFYNTAKSELNLLKTIGVTQMEKELIKKYKSIDKRTRSLQEHRPFEKDDVKEALHGIVDDLDKEKAREILHDVLTELYSKSRTNRKPDV
jgi:hypothetical protein